MGAYLHKTNIHAYSKVSIIPTDRYATAKMALKPVRLIGVLEYDHKVVTIDVYL